MKIKLTTPGSATLAALLLLFGGCATSHPTAKVSDTPQPAPEVRAAEVLFQHGRYVDAIVACIEISRKDPLTAGLADLQARIMAKTTEMHRAAIQSQQAATDAANAVDALRQGSMPDTYRLNRHVVGETAPLHTPPNPMQNLLKHPVSVHLDNVSLSDIVAQIGASENVNIVTDASVGNGKTITLHAENTPLAEILEYVGRNMGVTFSVGQNIIWVTPGNSEQGVMPMETRVYRLRKGLPGDEIPGAGDLSALAQAGDSTGGGSTSVSKKPRNRGGKGGKGGGNGAAGGGGDDSDNIGVVSAIKRFVAQPEGADMTFDTRAHALLVKNTRENLLSTEDIINALDIRPVQVLIEARFIDTQATDTRQLGIDWLLGGPVTKSGTAGNLVTPAVTDAGGNTLLNATTDASKNMGIGVGSLQSGAGTFAYQGVLDELRLRAVLQAMEQSGETRTLTSPRITTVNNKTATIHIGEDFQYYDNLTTTSSTQYYNGNAPANSVTNNTPVFSGTPVKLKLGYKLAVTPSVGADLSTINLALVPDITELQNKSDWEKAQNPSESTIQTPGKLPIVLQKTIETEVVVRSGETVILGGLAQASGTKTTTGLPWLAHLPLFGQLFRTDSNTSATENLLVFVTATLVSDVGEELVPLTPRELVGQPLPAGVR